MMMFLLVTNTGTSIIIITIIVSIIAAIICRRTLGGWRRHRPSEFIARSDVQLQLGRQNRTVVTQVPVATHLEHLQPVDESGVERQNPAKEVVCEVQVFEVTHLGNEVWDGPIELVRTEIQVNQTGYGGQGVRNRAGEGVGIQGEVFQRNEVPNGRGYLTLELIRRKDQNLEVVQHGEGGGYVSAEVVGRKIDVGEVGR
ncbi:hypothetical protein V8G54_000513, partial [Vigna mungo]